jgi:hypothetical protein
VRLSIHVKQIEMKKVQVWVNSDGQHKKHEYDILQTEGEKRIIISDESDWIFETKAKVVGSMIEYGNGYIFNIEGTYLKLDYSAYIKLKALLLCDENNEIELK